MASITITPSDLSSMHSRVDHTYSASPNPIASSDFSMDGMPQLSDLFAKADLSSADTFLKSDNLSLPSTTDNELEAGV